jgi:hypothetical protein
MQALLPLRHLRLALRPTSRQRAVTATMPPPAPAVDEDPRGPVLFDLLEI